MEAAASGERPVKWMFPFFTIWTGQAFSILGSQLVHFSLIWWLTVTTGSATVLASASIVGILPTVLLGPVAGAVVDRRSRRTIMILADGLVAAATLFLLILFTLEIAQPWQVYLVLFLRATAGAFHWPAMAASTSLMVPEKHLTRIQGANQTLNGALNIVSAPLGALLLDILPLQGILAIDIGTALLAILPLLFIRVPQPLLQERTGDGSTGRPSLWTDLRAGFQYVSKWPGVLGLMVMATLINLVLNPAFALLPILVKNTFGGEALQLAWIESAAGIGIVLGGLALSAWGGFRRRIVTSLAGLIGIGVGTLMIGLAPATAFILAVASMLFVGIMMPITNGPIFAVVQTAVAPDMQGRVFTLIGSLSAAMSPLGLAIAGPLSDSIGVQTWFLIGGAVTGLMGLAGFMIPSILYLEDHRHTMADSRIPEADPAAIRAGGIEIESTG